MNLVKRRWSWITLVVLVIVGLLAVSVVRSLDRLLEAELEESPFAVLQASRFEVDRVEDSLNESLTLRPHEFSNIISRLAVDQDHFRLFIFGFSQFLTLRKCRSYDVFLKIFLV